MEIGQKLSNQGNESDDEKSELVRVCNLFEAKYGNFQNSDLYRENLPERQGNPEAVSLLNKVKKLHEQFQEAVAENNLTGAVCHFPFLNISVKGKDSSGIKLVIEVIPSSGKGVFRDIDEAFEKMKEMIYMIAFYESEKGELKAILEFLKFLYFHINRRFVDEGEDAETPPYDPREASKLLNTINIVPSNALVKKHLEGIPKTENAGITWRRALDTINADVSLIERVLRDRLLEDIEKMDKTKTVQSDIRDSVEKNCTN